MDFDLEKDFVIFDALLTKRPEIIPQTLKEDLTRYYLPYVQKLIVLKNSQEAHQSVIVGVSAVQGTGKTTQGEVLEILLQHFGYSSISRSIDDHYITHKELCDLREKDPRFIRRGVTHDIQLALRDLQTLQQMHENEIVLVSGYDKGAHHGDGDRFRWVNLEPGVTLQASIVEEEMMVNKSTQTVKALSLVSIECNGKNIPIPEYMGANIPLVEHFLSEQLLQYLSTQKSDALTFMALLDGTIQISGGDEYKVSAKDFPNAWRIVSHNPAFIFYDGWMLGARKIDDESVFDQNLPALETPQAKQFAKYVNGKLAEYEPLWNIFNFMNVLYEPHYEMSLRWRDQAEDVLREKGSGMSHDEIREFIYYFWRSVHPAIHIKRLAPDTEHTNQVVIINDNHTVKEVLTPEEVITKYP